MKRYIRCGIRKGVDSEESLIAIQNIAKKLMNSRGFDTSSWVFRELFDAGYGKQGLSLDTQYGEARTILDMNSFGNGSVSCEFKLFINEEFDHSFFVDDADTTWISVANEYL